MTHHYDVLLSIIWIPDLFAAPVGVVQERIGVLSRLSVNKAPQGWSLIDLVTTHSFVE